MISLFSIFDLDSLFLYFPILFFFWILVSLSWAVTFCSLSYSLASFSLFSSFSNISRFKLKSVDILLLFLFIFIFFNNFISVFRFSFPLSSQLWFCLFLGISFWSISFFLHLTLRTKSCVSHFIPEGTPIYLIWFLFLIEIVSVLVRPITLTVRLLANIIAGHLLIVLLSKIVFIYFFCRCFYLFLNIVELFVAFIQSYIFIVMVYLYYVELY